MKAACRSFRLRLFTFSSPSSSPLFNTPFMKKPQLFTYFSVFDRSHDARLRKSCLHHYSIKRLINLLNEQPWCNPAWDKWASAANKESVRAGGAAGYISGCWAHCWEAGEGTCPNTCPCVVKVAQSFTQHSLLIHYTPLLSRLLRQTGPLRRQGKQTRIHKCGVCLRAFAPVMLKNS